MAERYTIASALDSALDADGMRIATYARERDNAQIVTVEGKEPTWFDCRILSRKEMKWVKAGANADEQAERAFSIGVVLIKNLITDNRQKLDEFKREGHAVVTGLGRVDAYSEEQLEQVPWDYILDIGSCVFARSFLVRESEVFYPVPHRLLAVWGAIGSRRADETRESSETSDSTTP